MTQDMIEVPPGTMVRCPKIGFDLAPLAACPDCSSFAGVSEAQYRGAALPFHRQHLCLCTHEPVKRELFFVPSLAGGA